MLNAEQDTRLRTVENQQVQLTQAVKSHTQVVDKFIVKCDQTIFGTPATPGLTIRMDREEQKSKNITRLIWILVSSAVGLGATYAATSFF